MGQKVNPHGMRVGVIKDWDSRWFTSKQAFGDTLVEDHKIRTTLKKQLYSAGIPKIEIERDNAKVRIYLHCARPGVVIGKGGEEIKAIEAKLVKMIGKPVDLKIVEVRNTDMNAQLVAENIAQQLEKRISFRRAMKKAMQHMLEEGKNLGANMRFVELMLPHHAMALEMSVPALLGSNNPQILNLAENIIISQAKEMRQFKAWIAEHHKK